LLILEFSSLAGFHHFGGITRLAVDRDLCDLALFIDQEIDAPADLAGFIIETVLLGDVAAPIAEQREGDVDFLRPCGVAEGAIHTDTQDLGVCSFQPLQILLEVLHLLGSTTGEGKDVKRQRDVLLAFEVVKRNLVFESLVAQGEIRRHVPDLQGQWRWWWRSCFLFALLSPQRSSGPRDGQREYP